MHTEAFLLIQDLAVIMLIAALTTILTQKLKQPVVLGYILAGIIIGPHTIPFIFIHSQTTIKAIAELGVVFLMFFLGLEFDLHKLFKVGLAAFVASFIEIILMIWLGYEIGKMFHWSTMNSIFLGAILAISSTTIIVKALEELKMKDEKFAQLIFGILVIEDMFAIGILALLSSIALSGSLDVTQILTTGAKLSTFLVVSLCLGILIVPRLLSYINKFNNKEMLLIVVLGLCLGFCLIVEKLGYSVALGAFIIGAIVAESEQLDLIQTLIEPLKNMFSAIFFVSVGLLFDPNVLMEYWLPITIITTAVIVGKVLSGALGVFIMGQEGRTSMRVGLGLSQIGEFSFIIAALGLTLNVTSHFLYPIAVTVSIITTFLTPYLIKYSDGITRNVKKVMPSFIIRLLQSYTLKLRNHNSRKKETEITILLRKTIFYIIINIFIVGAIFLVVAYSSQYVSHNILANYIPDVKVQNAIYWGSSLLIASPFLLAIYRKIKSISMSVVALSLKPGVDKVALLKGRKFISEIIPVIALIILLVFISAITASILPPVELIIVVLGVLFILIILLYAWFVKFHSKLQKALLEAMRKRVDK